MMTLTGSAPWASASATASSHASRFPTPVSGSRWAVWSTARYACASWSASVIRERRSRAMSARSAAPGGRAATHRPRRPQRAPRGTPSGASMRSIGQTRASAGAMHPRRDAERDALARCGAREVEAELGRERGGVERPVPEAAGGCAGEREDERRPHRMPCTRQQDERPLGMQASAAPLPCAARQKPCGDDERGPAGRQHEEHRHQDEHGRDARAAGHLELDAEQTA